MSSLPATFSSFQIEQLFLFMTKGSENVGLHLLLQNKKKVMFGIHQNNAVITSNNYSSGTQAEPTSFFKG